jgi:hypothetical protein
MATTPRQVIKRPHTLNLVNHSIVEILRNDAMLTTTFSLSCGCDTTHDSKKDTGTAHHTLDCKPFRGEADGKVTDKLAKTLTHFMVENPVWYDGTRARELDKRVENVNKVEDEADGMKIASVSISMRAIGILHPRLLTSILRTNDDWVSSLHNMQKLVLIDVIARCIVDTKILGYISLDLGDETKEQKMEYTNMCILHLLLSHAGSLHPSIPPSLHPSIPPSLHPSIPPSLLRLTVS